LNIFNLALNWLQLQLKILSNEIIMETITKHKLFFTLLSLSLFFFLIKGIRYAFIGSFVPIIFITLISLSLITFANKEKKHFKIAIWNWGLILILWSAVRFVIPILFALTPNLTETHIREQFVIPEFLISFIMLSIGIYLLRNVNKTSNTSTF